MTKDEFAARVGACEKNLYLSALSVTRNAHDAEDAVADAVCTAWERIGDLRDPDRFDGWLLQIALNEAKRIRRKSRVYADIDELKDSFGEDMDTGGMEFFDIISRFKTDDEGRRILSLRFFYDYTIAETARILKKPENTVKAKYYRVLQKLREQYEKEGKL